MSRVPRPVPSTPGDWFAETVRRRSDAFGPDDPASRRWVRVVDLLGGGDRSLGGMHGRLRDEQQVPPPTGAMYLAGWFAGLAAEVVGLGLATARAGCVVDPAHIRWHLHDDGWPERIELGTCEVLVEDGHPWTGQHRVTVLDTFDDVVRQAVGGLVVAVTPIIEECRRLAPVGLTGLWNEVGDGLVMVLRHDDDRLVVDDDMLAVVTAAAHLPNVPWRAHAELRVVDTEWGRACVGRKGGCCLAYKLPAAAFGHEDADPDLAEFRRRFPVDSAPQYCSTCSLREPGDAAARQLLWFELSRRRQVGFGRRSAALELEPSSG